jgi:hypothetical protein
MYGTWWFAGIVMCATCSLMGAAGNGLIVGIIMKVKKFRSPLGILILRWLLFQFNLVY